MGSSGSLCTLKICHNILQKLERVLITQVSALGASSDTFIPHLPASLTVTKTPEYAGWGVSNHTVSRLWQHDVLAAPEGCTPPFLRSRQNPPQ